jgi:Cu-processing system permease protein
MPVATIAAQEIRAGLRNRWVVGTTLLLAALALSLVLLGNAPTGSVGADPLSVVIVSLSSLTIFLLPLIALLLSFDSVVGEQERGTLSLLLAYPVARWHVVAGKFLGQAAIIGFATVLGYGSAALSLALTAEVGAEAWHGFAGMLGSSVLLGASFVALGALASIRVRERATAAGIAVGAWLFFVILYDTALLGILVADQGRLVTEPVLNALLLLNPTDAYRLFNLTASEGASVYGGMAGLGEAGQLSPGVLLGALVVWVLLPLGLAITLFGRKQI